MGKTKVIHTTYAAWDYHGEAEALNRESQNGWQLVKGGCLSSKLVEDHTVEYRYQLDFNPAIDNKKRYTETFLEQGWEHVSDTFNGWHYFRKRYDTSLPPEEYEIYTDIPTKREMTRRWSNRLMLPAAVFIGIILIVCIVRMVMSFELGLLGLAIELGIFEYILVYGAVKMRQAEKGIEIKKKFPLLRLLVLGIGGYLFFIVVTMGKGGTTFTADTMIHADTKNNYNTIQVKFPDFYYMDAEVSSAISTTISVEDEKGNIIYRQQGKDFAVTDHGMLLRRGTYKIHIRYDKNQIKGSEEKSSYVSYHID